MVLNLQGGADSWQMLLPHSGCGSGHDFHAELAAARPGKGHITVKKDDYIRVPSPKGTQPCDTFGVHPNLKTVAALYKEGDAAWVANMGSLTGGSPGPVGLFSHSVQQLAIQTVKADVPQGTPGVLGRIAAALKEAARPLKTAVYSLAGFAKILEGPWVSATLVNAGAAGVERFTRYAELKGDLAKMHGDHDSYSHFAGAFSSLFTESTLTTELLGEKMASMKLATKPYQTFKSKSKWDEQLHAIAKLIKLDTGTFGKERSMFVAANGGYDTHKGTDLSGQLGDLDDALGLFVAELKAQRLWENTTIVMVSEFGRSLITNTLGGTDHGYGGHYFILGGSINGTQIFGRYPRQMKEVDKGRGKMKPSTSWEALWFGVAEWFGVEVSKMDKVLPNAANFPPEELFGAGQLFERK